MVLDSNGNESHKIYEIFGDKVGEYYLAIEVVLFTENYNWASPLKGLRVLII